MGERVVLNDLNGMAYYMYNGLIFLSECLGIRGVAMKMCKGFILL